MNYTAHRHFSSFVLVFIIIFTLFPSCKNDYIKSVSNKNKKTSEVVKNYPKFEFSEEIHKFGVISEGEIAVCEFYYKNVGQSDLIITNIETSCGCTAVEWEKHPLKPGEKAKLTVEFDSKGRSGTQYKAVTIFCNTIEGTKELIVTAQVE